MDDFNQPIKELISRLRLENTTDTAESAPGRPIIVLAGTPLGNPEDITLRALRYLAHCDLLIAEERKPAGRLLSWLGLKKEIVLLNEHSRANDIDALAEHISQNKLMAVQISDGGMPNLADPGRRLVEAARQYSIALRCLPGPSALTTALALSGFDGNRFHFAGFVSPRPDERAIQLKKLAGHKEPVILYETPYRLAVLLADLEKCLKPARPVFVGLDLTLPGEQTFYGPLKEIRARLDERIRALPVIIF